MENWSASERNSFACAVIAYGVCVGVCVFVIMYVCAMCACVRVCACVCECTCVFECTCVSFFVRVCGVILTTFDFHFFREFWMALGD